jgi:hypothetical protein
MDGALRAANRSALDALIQTARRDAIRRGEELRLRVDADGAWVLAARDGTAILETGRIASPSSAVSLRVDALGTCRPGTDGAVTSVISGAAAAGAAKSSALSPSGSRALGRFLNSTVGFCSANAGCGGVVPTGTGAGLAAVAGAGLAAAAGAGVAATGAGLAAVAGAGLAAGIGAGLAAAAGAGLAAGAGAGLAVVAGAASALWHARRHCVRM